MDVNRFFKESGFKVLALANLGQCEYRVILYLLNTAVSGMDQFITTESELASLVGVDEPALRETLSELLQKKIIKLRYGDKAGKGDNMSLRIGLQYDVSKWSIQFGMDSTAQDAIVFPFRRQGVSGLQILEGSKPTRDHSRMRTEDPTWQRVIASFVQGRSLDEEEILKTEEAAKMLVETHPVDQVLIMLRHFTKRVPTLSLLASSWQHYQEIFLEETQKVDMLGARQKHQEFDQKIRDLSIKHLEDKAELELTQEEVTVLQVLSKHRHPRRQLFWAYQVRSRYPNLAGFFAELAPLMLGVTTSGTIVKRPTDS